jgi:hypothetical protein
MRKLLPLLLLGTAACVLIPAASAQGWDRVLALPAGTSVHIHATDHSAHCRLKSADADSLTCVSGDAKTEVFKKTEIKSIKVPHRGRSALAGAAIGGGTGAIIGAAAGQNGQIVGRGGLAAIFGIPLAIIGALVGVATDFTVATLYKA